MGFLTKLGDFEIDINDNMDGFCKEEVLDCTQEKVKISMWLRCYDVDDTLINVFNTASKQKKKNYLERKIHSKQKW